MQTLCLTVYDVIEEMLKPGAASGTLTSLESGTMEKALE